MEHPISPQQLIDRVLDWADVRDDVRALALVGSHARGDARPDSDIDLVLACTDLAHYVGRTDWAATFGEVDRIGLEDWGKVQSIRAI